MILGFPCAGFQSKKGFQWDAESLGLGLHFANVLAVQRRSTQDEDIFSNDL